MKDSKILVIDIETSGPSVLKNGILAVGYCLGDMYGNVLEKKRVNFELDDRKEFDSVCMNEFWNRSGPKKALDVIRKNTINEKRATEIVVSRIDEFDSKYDLLLVSDNPSFDFYFLNYYVELYMSRKPLNYALGKKYRRIYDAKSLMIACKKKYKDFKFKNVSHDHLPENDSEYIYKYYQQLIHFNIELH